MRAGIVAAACAICACHSTIVFEPPSAPDSAASLLLFADDGTDQLGYATAPISPGVFDPPLPELPNIESLRLSAAAYTCSLEELELASGRLDVGDPLVPLARPMAVSVQEDGAWIDRTGDEDVVARFDRLPWRSACPARPSLERASEVLLFDGDEQASAAFANGDVLIYTTARGVALLSGGTLSPIVQTATKARDMALISGDRMALVDLQGRVFLIEHEHALQPDRWQLIDARFAPTERDIAGFDVLARPGPSGASTFELVLANEAGTIELFDGARWIRLFEHEAPTKRLQVSFKDADEARVIGIGGPDASARIDMRTRTVVLDTIDGVPDQCFLSAVGYVEAIGWAFGTCDRMLIEGRAYASDVGASVSFLLRMSPTVLLASGADGYVLFDAERPECLERLQAVEIYQSNVARTPDGLVWIGGLRHSRAFRLRFVPPSRERPRCQLEALP